MKKKVTSTSEKNKNEYLVVDECGRDAVFLLSRLVRVGTAIKDVLEETEEMKTHADYLLLSAIEKLSREFFDEDIREEIMNVVVDRKAEIEKRDVD